MQGAEYVTGATVESLWRDLDTWVRRRVTASGQGLSAFLKEHAPLWHQVGRVCFHLAENRREPDYPFAFLATYAPVGGLIRVVLVKEDDGWCAFFCTDADASVEQILEAFADRATIEQVFHDLKEVWGAGEQQLRNIWSNVAAFHLNLWMHTLVEAWAWGRSHADLCDRSDSPWDDPERRPSHANRRKAWRHSFLRHELSELSRRWPVPHHTQE